jgi:transposase
LELELTALVTSITGISAAGAAAILADTGDPNWFLPARVLVKHAGCRHEGWLVSAERPTERP